MTLSKPHIRLVDVDTPTANRQSASTWSVLVQRAQRGDAAAFVSLTREHQGAVFAFAVAQLGDPTEACDAAQEALVKAFRKLKTYRFEAPFRTWLLQITRNACRDHFRKRQAAADGVRRYAQLCSEEPPPDPESQARKRELATEVHAALATVDPLFREVVILFDLQGHSYQEVASVCGIPLGTVKSRLARGREALRIALKERGNLDVPPASRERREKETP